MNRDKSGYEKAQLLELRVGRGFAWLFYIAFGLLLFVWVTGSQITVGSGRPMSGAQEFFGCVVLFWIASMSGLCEMRAEKALKEIWMTEAAAR